jgi:hypothetical protein
VDTDIYLFYGNADAVDQRNPTGAGVWEPNYVGVWHLNETVDDEQTTGTHYDSTWNYNHGSQDGNDEVDEAGGTIANGQYFDGGTLGSGDYVNFGDVEEVDGQQQLTISVWAKYNALGDWDTIITKRSAANNKIFFGLSGPADGDNDDIEISVMNNDAKWGYTTGNIISAGAWNLWTMVFDGSQAVNADRVKFYLNTTEHALTLSGTPWPTTTPSSSNPLLLGLEEGEPTTYPNAVFDEVRISKVARSPEWIATEHSNQSNPSGFYIVDTNECDNSNGLYDNRTPITIHGYQVSGTSGSLTDFPLLVSIDNDPELKTIENGGKVFNHRDTGGLGEDPQPFQERRYPDLHVLR